MFSVHRSLFERQVDAREIGGCFARTPSNFIDQVLNPIRRMFYEDTVRAGQISHSSA